MAAEKHPHFVPLALLFLICVVVYTCTDFGEILSPDSEIVFRQAANLAETGSLFVEELDVWKHFGVARGLDDRLYPVFGIGEAVALVPFITAAKYLVHTKNNPYPADVQRVADSSEVRFCCSFFNILITAISVIILCRILLTLEFSLHISMFAGVLYAFGTLAWPYADTFFSEPFASLLLLCALWLLLLNERNSRMSFLFLSGFFTGLATAVHITAILFAPFLLIYVAGTAWRKKNTDGIRPFAVDPVLFIVGLSIVLAAIGYYNFYRFGSVLETGRTIDPFAASKFGYGVAVAPWTGLYGLLLGGQKGLFLFCPLTLFSIYSWPAFHSKKKLLSWTLGSLCVFRLFFIAPRSDWHGGFCLGPRFLLMIIPFLMIPIAFRIQTMARKGFSYSLFLLFFTGVILQQFYFSFGEIFSFYVSLRDYLRQQGQIDSREMFYLNWNHSPLFSIHHGLSGPFLIRRFFVEYPFELWLLLSTVLGALIIFLQDRLLAKSDASNIL